MAFQYLHPFDDPLVRAPYINNGAELVGNICEFLAGDLAQELLQRPAATGVCNWRYVGYSSGAAGGYHDHAPADLATLIAAISNVTAGERPWVCLQMAAPGVRAVIFQRSADTIHSWRRFYVKDGVDVASGTDTTPPTYLVLNGELEDYQNGPDYALCRAAGTPGYLLGVAEDSGTQGFAFFMFDTVLAGFVYTAIYLDPLTSTFSDDTDPYVFKAGYNTSTDLNGSNPMGVMNRVYNDLPASHGSFAAGVVGWMGTNKWVFGRAISGFGVGGGGQSSWPLGTMALVNAFWGKMYTPPAFYTCWVAGNVAYAKGQSTFFRNGAAIAFGSKYTGSDPVCVQLGAWAVKWDGTDIG